MKITPEQQGAAEKVVAFYVDQVNATPSTTTVEELRSFAEDMEPGAIIKAMEYAIGEHKATWSYIKATLMAYKKRGIRTLADLQRANDEHQQARQRQVDGSAERVEKATGQILAISSQLHLSVHEFELAVENVKRNVHIS